MVPYVLLFVYSIYICMLICIDIVIPSSLFLQRRFPLPIAEPPKPTNNQSQGVGSVVPVVVDIPGVSAGTKPTAARTKSSKSHARNSVSAVDTSTSDPISATTAVPASAPASGKRIKHDPTNTSGNTNSKRKLLENMGISSSGGGNHTAVAPVHDLDHPDVKRIKKE